MTVHVKQIDGDWALCCDKTVRALVVTRHEGGQPLFKELLSKDGDCGCKGDEPVDDVRDVMRKVEVAPPSGKDDPDAKDPWKNNKGVK